MMDSDLFMEKLILENLETMTTFSTGMKQKRDSIFE